MARPPVMPAEDKTRIVLSVLAGEITVAGVARRAKVSEQSVGTWKRQFLEAGRAGLAAGKSGPSTREQQLEAEVSDLTPGPG
ncbi:helix-turn-helix domain-containing protein [Pseudonocardia sp. NPDC046786]|uniref:helix-turn-helix domain-containing protein n=1 Tax=Pseudonocardia sp. NPDC046786 TaxID=3155471 RepID=UPI003400572A